MNSSELWLFITILIVFIISFSVAAGLKGKVASIILTGGIGSILAGTFFGVVREILLNRPINGFYIFLIIILFYFWYIIVKLISNNIATLSTTNQQGLDTSILESTPTDVTTVQQYANDNKPEKRNMTPSISVLTKVFIGIISVLVLVLLGLSIYQQAKTGSGSPLTTYVIIISVMIVLAVIFSFFSGLKINNETKMEILSYTISYAIVFGILAPIFIFDSFKLTSAITSTFIFFVWMTLTISISNFIDKKPTYVNRS